MHVLKFVPFSRKKLFLGVKKYNNKKTREINFPKGFHSSLFHESKNLIITTARVQKCIRRSVDSGMNIDRKQKIIWFRVLFLGGGS